MISCLCLSMVSILYMSLIKTFQQTFFTCTYKVVIQKKINTFIGYKYNKLIGYKYNKLIGDKYNKLIGDKYNKLIGDKYNKLIGDKYNKLCLNSHNVNNLCFKKKNIYYNNKKVRQNNFFYINKFNENNKHICCYSTFTKPFEFKMPIKKETNIKKKLAISKSNNVNVKKNKMVKNETYDIRTYLSKEQKVDNKKIDKSTNNEHTNNEHTNGEHTNNEHTNGEHTNGEHNNNEHTNNEHTNGEHTNGEHNNNEHTNNEHSNKIVNKKAIDKKENKKTKNETKSKKQNIENKKINKKNGSLNGSHKTKNESNSNKNNNVIIKYSYPNIPISLEEKWKDYKKIKSIAEQYKVYLGAHVSASGGVQNSPFNCFSISGVAFAIFLKNQRQWNSNPLTTQNIQQFNENCEKYNINKNYILPHGSYLINLANPDKEKRERSYTSFLDDIKRCEQLQIKLYNFHPGSTVGLCTVNEAIKNIADCINRAHNETNNTIIVLENSAGQKNSVGSKFEHLRDIIELIKNKNRIGVCLDTCHTLAAGYDIKTYKNFDNIMKQFDKIVNIKYLKAVHLNDSKSDIGSGLDRHENIGKGKLTIDTFKYVMTASYFKNIPIILETPDVHNNDSVYKYEIEYLYGLCEQKST
ncbi:apurinic/apyrimidinic endonuclease Apn1, putative [Hepatocystis sp. ex Piliocolobus tephrosceles]|nr:apurinic/apyrimidinic endonuclease Apn1, putative [Hepatocystis sp. ex Piliocolobus tephrosceles]